MAHAPCRALSAAPPRPRDLGLLSSCRASPFLGARTTTICRVSVRRPARSTGAARPHAQASHDPARQAAKMATLTAALGLAAMPAPASAVDVQQVTDAFNKVQATYQQVSGVTGTAVSTAKAVLEQLIAVLRPAVDAASPVVQGAAQIAIKAAGPVASGVAAQAQKLFSDAGVDTKPALEVAKTAVGVAGTAAQQSVKVVEAAAPAAGSAVSRVLSADPLTLAEGGGVLLVLYLLAPSLTSAIGYRLRGFGGILEPAQALDLLTKQDCLLVDVRQEKEKAKSGSPSLPRSARRKLLALPVEELPGKLRGQLRDAKRVEAELTAIKISSLKRVTKGSKLIIIDSNGSMSKWVAKSLSALGYKKAYIVRDGVEGGKGWIQSRLETEPYNQSSFEILSPSRVIPAAGSALKRLGSGSGKTSVAEVVDVVSRNPLQKLLPGSSDD
eukprot:SM000153S01604  [mRNA]  locus=s153:292443:295279:+ [translate_table: standard]